MGSVRVGKGRVGGQAGRQVGRQASRKASKYIESTTSHNHTALYCIISYYITHCIELHYIVLHYITL